jgi:hypothetical protein
MPSPSTDENANRKRSRRTLWILLAVCAAPIVASYTAFLFWRPASHVNYGELLEPRLLPDRALATLDAPALRFSGLRGEWVLLAAGASSCDARCRRNLVYMRQVRLAQGRESERIERVWLLTDGGAPDAALVAEHPGLRIVRDAGTLAGTLPAPRDAADHVYVVDPLGHLMMRFPADPDPQRMLKDLSRLLRHSKWK